MLHLPQVFAGVVSATILEDTEPPPFGPKKVP
jgi:hypothetical protein